MSPMNDRYVREADGWSRGFSRHCGLRSESRNRAEGPTEVTSATTEVSVIAAIRLRALNGLHMNRSIPWATACSEPKPHQADIERDLRWEQEKGPCRVTCEGVNPPSTPRLASATGTERGTADLATENPQAATAPTRPAAGLPALIRQSQQPASPKWRVRGRWRSRGD